MLCEICGKEVERTGRVRIEGSVLQLCEECARFGERVDPPRPAPLPGPAPRNSPGVRLLAPRPTRRLEERDLYQEMPELELASDWNHRVRLARERQGWNPEELGKKLNEKRSVVLKLESDPNFRPPDSLVRKVEHLLRVRLRADPDPTA